MPSAAYQALVARVDGFAQAVAERRAESLSCRAGCAGCCQVTLSVSAVEAQAIAEHLASLPPAERQRLRRRGRAALRAEAAAESSVETERQRPCVMLRRDGTCSIYAARPLVCRSQGLPLLYPAELVPVEALLARTADGRAVVSCPLNFRDRTRPPLAADILDATRVDEWLAVVNRRHCEETGAPPLGRQSLAELASRAGGGESTSSSLRSRDFVES